jgi:membrane protease subunit (stomatin/prohibitin family)
MQQLRRLIAVDARLTQLGVSYSHSLVCAPRRACSSTTADERWTCSCGFNNYAFHRQCFRCNKSRDGAAAAPAVSPLSLLGATGAQHGGEGDGTAAPVLPAEGVWMCAACNTFNNAEREACLHCGESRPRPRSSGHPPKYTASADVSDTSAVTLSNRGARQPFRRGDWYCSCGAHNFARNKHCRECGAAAPLVKEEALRHPSSGGDWVCPECGKYNFSRRAECMRCRHQRPSSRNEGQQEPPTAPASLREWVCPACHAMNPSGVDSVCAICGTPK